MAKKKNKLSPQAKKDRENSLAAKSMKARKEAASKNKQKITSDSAPAIGDPRTLEQKMADVEKIAFNKLSPEVRANRAAAKIKKQGPRIPATMSQEEVAKSFATYSGLLSLHDRERRPLTNAEKVLEAAGKRALEKEATGALAAPKALVAPEALSKYTGMLSSSVLSTASESSPQQVTLIQQSVPGIKGSVSPAVVNSKGITDLPKNVNAIKAPGAPTPLSPAMERVQKVAAQRLADRQEQLAQSTGSLPKDLSNTANPAENNTTKIRHIVTIASCWSNGTTSNEPRVETADQIKSNSTFTSS